MKFQIKKPSRLKLQDFPLKFWLKSFSHEFRRLSEKWKPNFYDDDGRKMKKMKPWWNIKLNLSWRERDKLKLKNSNELFWLHSLHHHHHQQHQHHHLIVVVSSTKNFLYLKLIVVPSFNQTTHWRSKWNEIKQMKSCRDSCFSCLIFESCHQQWSITFSHLLISLYCHLKTQILLSFAAHFEQTKTFPLMWSAVPVRHDIIITSFKCSQKFPFTLLQKSRQASSPCLS